MVLVGWLGTRCDLVALQQVVALAVMDNLTMLQLIKGQTRTLRNYEVKTHHRFSILDAKHALLAYGKRASVHR